MEPLVTAAIELISKMDHVYCNENKNISTKFGYRLVSGRNGSILEDFGFEKYNKDVVKKVMLLRPTAPLAFNEFLLDSFSKMFVSSKAKAKVGIFLKYKIEHQNNCQQYITVFVNVPLIKRAPLLMLFSNDFTFVMFY